jgi:hypothetical protein
MAGAIAGMAARYLAPMAAQAAGTFVQGKMGEAIGDHNINQAQQIGQANYGRFDQGTTTQSARGAESVTQAQEGANARSMGREAFLNQMTQANKRADNEDQRTTYEQDNAFRRGETLANNYANAASNQAQSNNNVLATMLGVSGQARR